MPDDSLFEVIESERFLADAAAALGDFWAWEDIKGAFDFALARDPLGFNRISGTELYWIQIATSPPHAVYFTVDTARELVTLEALF